MREQDEAESTVEEWLRHLGCTNVVFEPDGNVPPDFLVDGTIAVEVRRLNKHMFDGVRPKGLEQDDFPLRDRITALLKAFGTAKSSTWWVDYNFSRPVRVWSKLEPELRQWLEAVQAENRSGASEQRFGDNFSIRAIRRREPKDQVFEFGGYMDEDSSGWLLDTLKRNINHCVAEKSKKIQKVAARYPVWWLALVDHIGYALKSDEREMIAGWSSEAGIWDRVVLISPLDSTSYFEVPRVSEI